MTPPTAELLPPVLHELRSHLATSLNAINELERMNQRGVWADIPASEQKKARAYRSIEQRVVKACELIGVRHEERVRLHDVIASLQTELERQRITIDTMMKERA